MKKSISICVAAIAFAFGCSKENSSEKQAILDKEYEAKLFKFIENTIGVPKDDIQYSSGKDSLILYGKIKIGIDEISNKYDNANIYKKCELSR